MRRLLVVLALALVVMLGCPAVGAEEGATFLAPVAGRVVDPWRAPVGPFGAGNRGIDFEAEPGQPVVASADGEVTFAGQVGGSRHVVVLHPGGIRTSYSFLAAVEVRRGDQVAQGQRVGTSGPIVHFGVRLGADYVDPARLLGVVVEVHLVPDRDARPRSVGDEIVGLLSGLGGGIRVTRAGLSWLARTSTEAAADVLAVPWLVTRTGVEWMTAEVARLALLAELATYYATLPYQWFVAARRLQEFRRDQAGCTPPGVPPRRPPGRRIAVLVSGYESTSSNSAVLEVDTRALGYDDHDVAVFSYAGGQSPGIRRLDGIAPRPFDTDDANGDPTRSAARLRALLASVRASRPGVPVDVIAFSHGGVVARAAVAGTDPRDPRQPRVDNLVTLGSPHHGTNLATGAAALTSSSTGWGIGRVVEGVGGIDTDAPAVAALRAGSPFIEHVGRQPLPAATRFTSIAAAGDLVVPAPNSAVGPATNVLLPTNPGPSVHDDLPGSEAAHDEIALAIAGMGPTCRRILKSAVQATAIVALEDSLSAAATIAAFTADRLTARLGPHPPTNTRTPGQATRQP